MLRRGLLRVHLRLIPARIRDGVDDVRLRGEHGARVLFVSAGVRPRDGRGLALLRRRYTGRGQVAADPLRGDE